MHRALQGRDLSLTCQARLCEAPFCIIPRTRLQALPLHQAPPLLSACSEVGADRACWNCVACGGTCTASALGTAPASSHRTTGSPQQQVSQSARAAEGSQRKQLNRSAAQKRRWRSRPVILGTRRPTGASLALPREPPRASKVRARSPRLGLLRVCARGSGDIQIYSQYIVIKKNV